MIICYVQNVIKMPHKAKCSSLFIKLDIPKASVRVRKKMEGLDRHLTSVFLLKNPLE
jgi:hypothetical protein